METERARPFETYDATISSVTDLTPRVKALRFSLPPGKEIHFRPGQFIQVFIPMPDKVRRTSYSIASPPQETTHVDLCVTLVQQGVSSPYLHHLSEGSKLQIMGPLGKFTLPEPLPRDIVFVATGSGIAPFRSMILDLLARKTPRNIQLVFGNRFQEDIIYRKEWETLTAAHTNLTVTLTLSKPDEFWTGLKGYVQEALGTQVTAPEGKDFYICGLKKMIDDVSAKLTSLGVPADQIHFERYD